MITAASPVQELATSENHSTTPPARVKPARPSPDFPLTAHATGRWCKKIAGRTHYFGRWGDPEGALKEYQAFVAGKPVKKRRLVQSRGDRPPSPTLFPLYPHGVGQWAKKIRSKTYTLDCGTTFDSSHA